MADPYEHWVIRMFSGFEIQWWIPRPPEGPQSGWGIKEIERTIRYGAPFFSVSSADQLPHLINASRVETISFKGITHRHD
jgi:hypothetical protein